MYSNITLVSHIGCSRGFSSVTLSGRDIKFVVTPSVGRICIQFCIKLHLEQHVLIFSRNWSKEKYELHVYQEFDPVIKVKSGAKLLRF
jgi:hypothetical protein